MSNSIKYPQILVAIAANGGSFIFGILLGWSSPARPQILNENFDFFVSSTQFSLAVSMMALGGAISCMFSGILRNLIGTKYTIAVFSLPIVIGWLLIIFAVNPAMFMIGRLFAGFSAGAYCFVIPIYVGEISSNEIRGGLLSSFQVILNMGVTTVYTVGYFANLRTLNIVCGIIPIIYTLIFMLLPESPGFLVRKGKREEAEKSMILLRGKSFDYKPEINELMKQHQEMSEKPPATFMELFQKPAIRKAFFIIMTQFFFFQMSGINAVLFYMTTIFIEADIRLEPALATIIVGCVQVIGSLLSTFLVDKIGRKILLVLSTTLMTFGLIGIGVYFTLKEADVNVDGIRWLSVASLSLFVMSFSSGMGPISYVLLGELFAPDAKSKIAPMGQMFNLLLSFMIGMVFPILIGVIGTGPTFFIFSGFTTLALLFSIFIIPETKGKSLVEIQNQLTKSSND